MSHPMPARATTPPDLMLIAAEARWLRLMLVVGVSVVLSYLIVFYAEFGGRQRRRSSSGATQGPVTETLLAYVIAFAASWLLLATFGRLNGRVGSGLAEIVVLSFPASLGAALGRVLV